jgi:hypothetical protein
MKTDIGHSGQLHSYLALRNAVGWIGILLPFILMLGVILLFNGKGVLITISQYYYTGMRDVMVGSLCAIALFLFFYKGYDRLDDIAGNLAGFFALGVALFPTVESGPNDLAGKIHFVCAALFFITLSAFSLFLFTRKDPKPTPRKLIRNKIYIICGIVMVLCLAATLIFFRFFMKQHPESTFVFWAETLALTSFGISWLTKGGTILPDKKA